MRFLSHLLDRSPNSRAQRLLVGPTYSWRIGRFSDRSSIETTGPLCPHRQRRQRAPPRHRSITFTQRKSTVSFAIPIHQRTAASLQFKLYGVAKQLGCRAARRRIAHDAGAFPDERKRGEALVEK